MLFYEKIAWSHSICIQNLGSIGPTVPEIENFTVMTSSKWKIIVICLVENCLSYNISKSGRKLITGKRDTKQRKIWPLTFICITKMASYQVDVFMWFDRLVTLHTHTTFRLNYKTKEDLTFDLHLHSQDGLISTWCYYDICLPDHTPYAHKIWAQWDPRLLRYKTKEDLTFDLHLHNQDGLISSWCFYVIWSSGHTPYAYKI